MVFLWTNFIIIIIQAFKMDKYDKGHYYKPMYIKDHSKERWRLNWDYTVLCGELR